MTKKLAGEIRIIWKPLRIPLNTARNAPTKPVQRLSAKERLSRRGKKSRTKGHSFERVIAQRFRRWFPKARRGLQYQDGIGCADVEGTDFFIECKRRASYLNATKIFKTIIGDDRPVVLVWKLDNQPINVGIQNGLVLDMLDWPTFASRLDREYPIVNPAK